MLFGRVFLSADAVQLGRTTPFYSIAIVFYLSVGRMQKQPGPTLSNRLVLKKNQFLTGARDDAPGLNNDWSQPSQVSQISSPFPEILSGKTSTCPLVFELPPSWEGEGKEPLLCIHYISINSRQRETAIPRNKHSPAARLLDDMTVSMFEHCT